MQLQGFKDVAVLGGGITGLATALYVSRQNPDTKISIYEARNNVGGWLQSRKVKVDDGEILFEAGPRTLRPAGNGVLAARLSHELGLDNDTIFTFNSSPAATSRFIYYPDRLVQVPHPRHGLFNVIKTLISEPAFRSLTYRLPLEPALHHRDYYLEDQSIGDFLARRFGAKLVDRVVSAVFHGIYAGDVYQLSANSLMPTQWRDELETGSIMEGVVKSMVEGPEYSARELAFTKTMKGLPALPKETRDRYGRASVFTYRHGLQQLVEKMKEHLAANSNVKFLTNTQVTRLHKEHDGLLRVSSQSSTQPSADSNPPNTAQHSHIVSALSPTHLANLVSSASLAYNLMSIPAVTVMTVNLYYRTPYLHPPGFGYLIPLATPLEQNPERALGVVFDTSYSSDPGSETDTKDMYGPHQDSVSSRGTKMTVMLGGHYWSDWPGFPTDEEGLEMAKSLLRRHLGITEDPAASAVNLQKDCIPQYTVGHEKRIRSIHQKLLDDYSGKLRIASNWARGVGVNDCLRSAWDIAQELDMQNKTGLEAVVEDSKFERVKPVKKKQTSKLVEKS
ncbi:hypothetical protein MBLNU457_2324t1 [Dothideomycetes sp. NU457]